MLITVFSNTPLCHNKSRSALEKSFRQTAESKLQKPLHFCKVVCCFTADFAKSKGLFFFTGKILKSCMIDYIHNYLIKYDSIY